MIKATKIIHRAQIRIKVDFPYNQAFIALLRQIEDDRWSATHKAWHIPYTQIAFAKLKSFFPEIEMQTNEKVQEKINSIVENPKETQIVADKEQTTLPQISSIVVEVIGRKILIKLPKNESDTKFILTLRFSRWDKMQRVYSAKFS